MDLVIRIAGEAGQGVISAGDLLMNILVELDLYISTDKSYMSRVRGGLNWYDIRVSDNKVSAPSVKSDILLALSDDSLRFLSNLNKSDGLIFFNTKIMTETKHGLYSIDFAKEAGQSKMINSYAAGIVFGLLALPVDNLEVKINIEFHNKEAAIISKNIEAVRLGYQRGMDCESSFNMKFNSKKTPNYMISGASAIGLSAAVSGIKFVSSYPMSPATGTFTYLAGVADKYNIVVEQAEDEISAINMICGATYAGVPAMTTTSGGGFALMCEGISLAGMAELPVFVLIAQRPGPATGLPTRTAQEDLRFALHAGHGEFPRAIYAPGTIEQCYQLTRIALETAHKYQSPVIMLTDQYLQDHIENIPTMDDNYRPIDRHIELHSSSDYKSYAMSENGISPRAIPGGRALVLRDSNEHNEEGHLVEDFEIRIQQQNKRMRKLDSMISESLDPEFYGVENAEQLIVCWGSSYGACRETVDLLNSNGTKISMLHFSQLWPLNVKELKKFFRPDCKIFIVESNFTGQFASMLKEQGLVTDCKLILRYDGIPFSSDYIIKELEQHEY